MRKLFLIEAIVCAMLLLIYILILRMVLTSHELQLPARITIEEVAKTAGVSISTVSRALAGKKGVGDATRTQILKIAAELGYRTSSAARTLRTSRTHTLAYLAHDLENPHLHIHMAKVIDIAAEFGYSVIVINAVGAVGSQLADKWQRHDVNFDGLIVGQGRFDFHRDLLSILQSNMPVEPRFKLNDPDLDSAEPVIPSYFDRRNADISAIFLAVKRLVTLGHRRMTFVTPKPMSIVSKGRLQGIRRAGKENGLDENAITSIHIAQAAHAVGQIQQLISAPDSPTVIITPGGILNPHILRGLASTRIRIPEDVSVLAFGDSILHRSYNPPLSVINYDIETVARNQIERLIAIIEGKPIPEIVSTPSEFIERGSFAAAP
jgi:LacI family transcriptional regulator